MFDRWRHRLYRTMDYNPAGRKTVSTATMWKSRPSARLARDVLTHGPCRSSRSQVTESVRLIPLA